MPPTMLYYEAVLCRDQMRCTRVTAAMGHACRHSVAQSHLAQAPAPRPAPPSPAQMLTCLHHELVAKFIQSSCGRPQTLARHAGHLDVLCTDLAKHTVVANAALDAE